ncbi:MAG: DNA/RNA non-specific endonuclease [Acetatifactor sp.]|nr:DNA/RNA non-specific endonuclease [Acetatifactor sp.]
MKQKRVNSIRKKKLNKSILISITVLAIVLAVAGACWGCGLFSFHQARENPYTYLLDFETLDLSTVPEYIGEPYVELNGNEPMFTDGDKLNPVFEYYSDLDRLGRCGVATACLGRELMPTEPRGNIGHIRPAGWHTVKYPALIEDIYLYNRSHLIAFSLAGENDNRQNLITGTRYMNHTGMLPFENMVARYLDDHDGNVLYRVTPCYVGKELVARGVHMEAYSLADHGKSICFNVYVYNVQPGIEIDYLTGESWEATE